MHTTSNRNHAFDRGRDLVRSSYGLRISQVCLSLPRESWAWQTGLSTQ